MAVHANWMEVDLEPDEGRSAGAAWHAGDRDRRPSPMIGRRAFRAWASTACILLAFASDATASWTRHAPLGLPVCAAPGDQDEPRVVSDGAGGAIVVWLDGRAGKTDVYAQHVLASGRLDPAWPADGLAVCAAPGDQNSVALVTDGAGGAIVVWCDLRSGARTELYAHRVLASGALDPQWPRDGRPVCTGSGHQSEPVMVADGRGGAIVVWQNLSKGVGTDIYAQRLPASGVMDPAWPPEGRVVGGGAATQSEPATVGDGIGGAIVVWRESHGANDDLYGQHLLGSGVIDPAWPVNGRVFCSAPGRQVDVAMVADGGGGAIVGWLDLRSGVQDLYVHHLTGSGSVDSRWPADGLALRTSEGEGPGMVGDGVGGALVGWTAARGEGQVVHVQRVLSTGVVDPQWPAQGRTLGAGAEQGTPSMVSDGTGGAIVVWMHSRDGGRGIYAQHVLASGVVDPAWTAEARMCAPDGEHADPTSIPDGGGGALSVWTGTRGEAIDIYAQRVSLAGVVGVSGPDIATPPVTPAVPGDRATAVADSALAAADSARAVAQAETPGATPAEVAQGEEQIPTAKIPGLETSEPEAAAADSSARVVDGEPRPGLRASLVPGSALKDLLVDGKLTESFWSSADSIANLVTTEPEEGGVPAGRTVVRVLAAAEEIVIGVRCFDADPSGIVSFSKARDAELDEEDNVLVVIDTFGDGRSGYAFAINPGGSRFDGLINPQGDDANRDWDAVWEGSASVDSSGWSAEFRLPIKSLSFPKGTRQWGFNVERHVQRLQETSRWSGAKRDYQIWQTSKAGLLLGLPDFDLGRGLQIQPGWVSYLRRKAPGAARDAGTRLSLDVRQKLGANLTSALTLNTDFGETEADVRQTNLSRFDIVYPERRAFFLEGSDIFEFGSGLNVDDAEIRPFFSRRIGFVVPEGAEETAGREVQIQAGGKLQGHVGQASVGALVVSTDPLAELGVPRSGMAVVRLRQNVLTESSAGLIATFGGPSSRGGWTEGIDFNFKTSSFAGDRNLLAGVWGLTTHQIELGEDRDAYGGMVAYPNDPLSLRLTLLNVGEDFDPLLGFVQRTGGILHTKAEYKPRPNWPLVRQTSYAVTYFRALTKSGRWESEVLTAKPFDWLLTSGDRLAINIESQGEQPEEAFGVFESPNRVVTIPGGTYRWNRFDVTGTLASKRRISGELGYAFGGFYQGRLHTVAADIILQPLSVLTLQLGAERNNATLPQGDFTQYLTSLRTEYKPSPLLQVTNFVQYDNESRSLGSASRLRWSFHPLGDLFLTSNHNLLRSVTAPKWDFVSDKVSLKIQYAWRY